LTSEARYEPRWPLATAIAPLSLWILILTAPMWTGAFLGGPLSDQYMTGWAFRHWGAEQWKALGHVPLWNPEIFGGLPFVGAMHGDIFYPTAWLRLVLPTTLAMNLGFAVHYVLAGVLVYVLLRMLAVSWTGSVAGGLVYQLSGVIGSYVSPGHDGKLFVTTLLPVALIGLLLGFRKHRYEGFAILALAVGLGVVSPQHQMLYYMLVASGIFALYLAFGDADRPPRKAATLKLAAALAAVVVGLGIGMIQLLPFFAYLPFSPRAETIGGYARATSYAIPWAHVPELFLSRFAGSTGEGTYWGPNGIKLHSEYLGLPALGLAALGAATRERRRLILWLGGIAVLFLLVALGGSTPFYRLWYAVMPYMKQVRASGMALYIVCLVVAIFAAFGVERLERRDAKGWPTWWMAVGGVVAFLGLVGVVGAVADSMAQSLEMATGRPAAQAARAAQGAIRLGVVSGGGALAATGLIGWAWGRGRLKPAAAGLLLLATVSADLWWNARPFWRYTNDYDQLHQPDGVTERVLEAGAPLRVLHDLPPASGAPAVYDGAALMSLGIPQLLGHHGVEIHRFNELLGGQFAWPNALSPAIWDLYAVDFIVLPSGMTGLDSIPRFTRVLTGEPTASGTAADLFRRAERAPYARLVPAAVTIEDEPAAEALARGQVALDRLLLLPPDDAHQPAPVDTLPPATGVAVAFDHWEPGAMRMRLTPRAPRDGYLLVSENWYPDWRATVDGVETDVLRGNVSLITVPVPEGATEVELRFVSDDYRRGKLLTWIGIVVTVIGLVVPPALRRRRRD